MHRDHQPLVITAVDFDLIGSFPLFRTLGFIISQPKITRDGTLPQICFS